MNGPNRPVAFRDLPAGVTFQFDHGEGMPRFEKTGAAEYRRVGGGGSYTIGSGGAYVTAVTRPSPPLLTGAPPP